MYIQPPERERPTPSSEGYAIPKNYSGNAFRSDGGLSAPPPTPDPPPQEDAAPTSAATQEPLAEDVPAWKPQHREERGREREDRGGILSRIPLLSSLLPPSRGNKKGSLLPEWAVIAAVILLFLWEDDENDILPFLLLLLLWD
ncbi:MAG: hypothetical protein IJY50_00390 [Clostridia bacterium]|nr:hypothetical protein [Clostridia bacterium]